MDKNTNDKIKNELKQNEVCLFMKGTPAVPQCGFSLAVSNVLKHLLRMFELIHDVSPNVLRLLRYIQNL